MTKLTRKYIIDSNSYRAIKIQLPTVVVDRLSNTIGIETYRTHDCNNDFIITEEANVELSEKHENSKIHNFTGKVNVVFVRNSTGLTAIVNLDGLTYKIKRDESNISWYTKGNQVLTITVRNRKVVDLCDNL